jgi:hypothetical protein
MNTRVPNFMVNFRAAARLEADKVHVLTMDEARRIASNQHRQAAKATRQELGVCVWPIDKMAIGDKRGVRWISRNSISRRKAA